ncbi:MAG: hypothetical protein ACLRRT_15255 [Ruthenibacterium lactatiformans]
MIVSIRREVEALGGKVLNTPLTGLRVRDGRLAAVCAAGRAALRRAAARAGALSPGYI